MEKDTIAKTIGLNAIATIRLSENEGYLVIICYSQFPAGNYIPPQEISFAREETEELRKLLNKHKKKES